MNRKIFGRIGKILILTILGFMFAVGGMYCKDDEDEKRDEEAMGLLLLLGLSRGGGGGYNPGTYTIGIPKGVSTQ